ncbi:hypothetical protein [Sphingobium aromaticiconvertens]|uniref:hypothetical protein n=1 Tax=Sphingobium aromaticiconvertens TaxID=365341 RepID=UPI003017DB6C
MRHANHRLVYKSRMGCSREKGGCRVAMQFLGRRKAERIIVQKNNVLENKDKIETLRDFPIRTLPIDSFVEKEDCAI